jgi:L-ascorbate metabolism protein UlaG (beta-lactamase superfamily)
MRKLEDIDFAFVCMNLPYTMTMEDAADAVLDFKPRVVYPFHYRNKDGTFMDTEQFAEMVTKGDKGIEVRVLDWYK